MPLLSIIEASFSVVLFMTSKLSYTTALITSIVFSLGWLSQTGTWLDCEVQGPAIQEEVASYCPQYTLLHQGRGVAESLGRARIGLAWVVIACYLAYVALAVTGIVRTKRTRNNGTRLEEIGTDKDLS